MNTVAVFNNKGGVGKTSLVYHLAWMYAELGSNVLVADLDPQANLTSMFLDDDAMERLWTENGSDGTIYSSLLPLLEGIGDVAAPSVHRPAPGIGLVAGDMLLSGAEDELSSQWPDCMDGKPRAFRVLSALSRAISKAAGQIAADLILVDVGPNLGALNRAALLAADHVVVPLAPDLYSIQGLRNLGPTLRRWRQQWVSRKEQNQVAGLELPRGEMRPIGYVVLQHAVRLDRPVKAYERWMDRIPGAYRDLVLEEPADDAPSVADDIHCLGTLKHFRSLMPLAQEARKPMFLLKAADGALGGHTYAVQGCHRDFRALATRVSQASQEPSEGSQV
jgi:cellulose biosynthesis protein BcsQ